MVKSSDMISTVIVSEDKPAQLNLLLDSLYQNGRNLFDITVLYKYSSPELQKGYMVAQQRFYQKHRYSHKYPVRWAERESTNLSDDLLFYLKNARLLTCIFNDQNVLFSNDLSYRIVFELFSKYNPCTLSLRLGNNTVIQNPYENEDYLADIPSEGEFVLDKFLAWDATLIEPYTNFAIPFSTNGHIYRSSVLKDVLESSTPIYGKADFEVTLQKMLYEGNLSKKVPYLMSCPEYSMVIHNSINRIHDKGVKEDEIEPGITDEDINERYLKGKTIDYKQFDFKHISKPFQEFMVTFHED